MSEPENTRFRDSNVSAWLCNAHIFWKYMQRGANLHALTTIPLQVYCLPRMYGPFLYAMQGCARVARTERHPKMERAHWCQMWSRQRHAIMITYEFLTPVGWAFMYKRLRGITGHLYIKMAAWPDVPISLNELKSLSRCFVDHRLCALSTRSSNGSIHSISDLTIKPPTTLLMMHYQQA